MAIRIVDVPSHGVKQTRDAGVKLVLNTDLPSDIGGAVSPLVSNAHKEQASKPARKGDRHAKGYMAAYMREYMRKLRASAKPNAV